MIITEIAMRIVTADKMQGVGEYNPPYVRVYSHLLPRSGSAEVRIRPGGNGETGMSQDTKMNETRIIQK